MAESFEARFSTKVRARIHDLGRKTYKISQRFDRGMPDIYLPVGTWIESKVVYYAGPRSRAVRKPIKHFSNVQRWILDNLARDGDLCLVALLWVVDYGTQRFTLMPWKRFRHILLWNVEDIMHFSDPIENATMPIEKFWEGRDVKMEIFEDRFSSWKNRYNDFCYDETTTSDHWYYENGILIGGKNNPVNIEKFSKVAIGSELAGWLNADGELPEDDDDEENT